MRAGKYTKVTVDDNGNLTDVGYLENTDLNGKLDGYRGNITATGNVNADGDLVTQGGVFSSLGSFSINNTGIATFLGDLTVNGVSTNVNDLNAGIVNVINLDASGAITSATGITNNGLIITSTYDVLGSVGASPVLDFTSFQVIQITPTVSTTVTANVPPAGTYCSLVILTSGATSRTLTFSSTFFRTTGTLATGTVTARWFTINFISDGTELIEMSRTTAMA